MKRERRPDVNKQESKLKGNLGLIENFIRKSRNLAALVIGALILTLFALILGLSLAPGVWLVLTIYHYMSGQTLFYQGLACALAIGFSFPMFIVSLIFIVPLFNKLLPLPVKAYRGPWYALPTIGWYVHNSLTYLVRYTVLDLITPSPLNVLFFKMMGMKIGRNVMINTSNISDPCLIELGDHVTIGGSATMMAHYGMDGYLVIDKLVIGKRSMVGLKASLFGGVTIGENSMIAPGAIVYPKTIIGDDIKFGYRQDFAAAPQEGKTSFGGEDI